MFKYFSVLLLLLSFFVACGGGKNNGYEKLNGTWSNPMMTAEYDTKKGISKITALGETTEKKIKLVKDHGNSVVFLSGDAEITAQFNDNDTMVLTKKGGVPLEMKRNK